MTKADGTPVTVYVDKDFNSSACSRPALGDLDAPRSGVSASRSSMMLR